MFLLPVMLQHLFPHFEKAMQNGKSVVSVSVLSLGVKFLLKTALVTSLLDGMYPLKVKF